MRSENQLPQAVIDTAERMFDLHMPEYTRSNAYNTVLAIKSYVDNAIDVYLKEQNKRKK